MCLDLIADLIDQNAELVKNRREIEKLQEQISLMYTQLLVKTKDNIHKAKLVTGKCSPLENLTIVIFSYHKSQLLKYHYTTATERQGQNYYDITRLE